MMDRQQAIKFLVEDLMFHGCQKLNTTDALELAEKILDNKIPFLAVNDDTEFKEKVAIQSNANKDAAMEAMSRFIPEKISAEDAFNSEVRHWHKVFISSSLCSGKSVAESIEDANDAITSLYGALAFELITSK